MSLRNLVMKPLIMTYKTSSAKLIMLSTCLVKLGGGYANEPSIFDNITQDDLILAFFPCTRFEAIIPLKFRGEAIDQKGWDLVKKLRYSMKLQDELTELYNLLCMLCVICSTRGLKLVIENPYTQPHYLTTYWCVRPSIIDKDRTERGDYYKKPTQYFFINCEPYNNIIFEPLDWVETKVVMNVGKGNTTVKTERSLIHPQYANRFIREFLIEGEI